MSKRDRSCDGFRNKLEYHLLSRYRPFWRAIHRVPALESRANKLIINSLLNKTAPRPYPHSCACKYTSWTGLTDQSWYSRHLPQKVRADLPDEDDVLELFAEDPNGPVTSTQLNRSVS